MSIRKALKLFKTMKVVDLKDGDAVLVCSPQSLTQEQKERAWHAMRRVFPERNVIVMDDGWDVKAIRQR